MVCIIPGFGPFRCPVAQGPVQPVRRLRLEPAFHEVGPAARALRRFGGGGRPAAAHAADSRFPHDIRHPAAADLGRIPAPRRRPDVRPAVPVHDRGVCLVAPTERRLRRPGSLATCSTALNSGVYLVPFAMVPSSPIELGEMRNKNQFISHLFCVFH